MTFEAPPLQDAQVLMSLVRVKGVRNRTALELFSSTSEQRKGTDPREYFDSLASQYSSSPGMHEWAWELSGRQLRRTCDAGIRVIPFFGDDYPDRLRRIDDPPVVLFAKGEVQALHHPRTVAVVGTREPTFLGERAALSAGRLAAEAGIVVVSGLALGCDTRAHQGCVELHGTGVAVLANGLDRVYPAANKDLASQILDSGGCLVSESPVGAKLTRWAFAYRDRIQSGISDRVLVIETDVKGGTMHTVKFSQQQERPLACINHPQQFLSASKTRGNQMLIDDGTAVGISDQQELESFIKGIPLPADTETPVAPARNDFLSFLSLKDKDEVTTDSHITPNRMFEWIPLPTEMSTPSSAPAETECHGPSLTPSAVDESTPTSSAPPGPEQLTMALEDSQC